MTLDNVLNDLVRDEGADFFGVADLNQLMRPSWNRVEKGLPPTPGLSALE